jgi:hypothetical protein
MMTAFIAVVAAVSPTIKKQFFEVRNSDISAVLVQDRADSLIFLSTNNGTRVGAITEAFVEIPWLEKPEIDLEVAAQELNRGLQERARRAAREAQKQAESASTSARGSVAGAKEALAVEAASEIASKLAEVAKIRPTEWTSARVAAELAAIDNDDKRPDKAWTPVAREYLPEGSEPYFLSPGSTEPKKFVPKSDWYSGTHRVNALLHILPYPLGLLDFNKCRVTIKGRDANGDLIFKTSPIRSCNSFVHALEAEFETQYVSLEEMRHASGPR